MTLLLHDSLATTVFVEPVRRDWVVADFDVRLTDKLRAALVPADAFALVPSPECTWLTDTHVIVPEIAVVAEETGSIAMRSPVRPDEISDAKVLLYESSATAELLARALMWPYYGAAVRAWVNEPEEDVTITIVENALALREPEAGYSEDLVRAWFVMTGLPVVSHLLLAPVSAGPDAIEQVVQLLNECLRVSHERRRELRQLMDEDHGVERDRLVDALAHQHYRLDDSDRNALGSLIVKGAGGSAYRPLTRLPYLDTSAQEAS